MCALVLCSRHADLIFTVLRDVAYPWKSLVAAFLDDLEVADLDTGDSEVWNLKLDLDRHATVLDPLFRLDGGEAELGTHEELLAASELLDAPDHRVGVRDVLDSTDICLEDRRVDIGWNRDNDLHIVSNGLRLELGFSLDQVLNLRACEVFDDTLSPDEWLDVRIKAVSHQVELAIRRDERDVPLLLELVQADALMELNVLHLDEFSPCRPVLHLKQHLVVETELELGHAGQETAHVDAPKDLRA